MELLVVMSGLSGGGAEKSLVSFLATLQKTHAKDVNVDLLVFRPEGLFLPQVPENVHWIFEPKEYRFEKQLRGPSAPNVHRKEFLKLYSEGNGFDASVQCACKKEMQRYFVMRTFHVKEIRLACRKLVPTKLKKIIKKGAKYFSALQIRKRNHEKNQ